MRRLESRIAISVTAAAAFSGLLLLLVLFSGMQPYTQSLRFRPYTEDRKMRFSTRPVNRKLLKHEETNRMGERCSKDDIRVYQGATTPLPSGIPTYTVEILNVCVTGCSISAIHLTCGWFSSARMINPTIFKRLRYNDCLVNNGKPLPSGGSLSFQYANTFRYPLSVASITC